MGKKEQLQKIETYLDSEMVFSALKLLENIAKNSPSEYDKFKYADTLRLCGFFEKAEKVFLEINSNLIPQSYRYYYHLHFGILYMNFGFSDKSINELLKCLEFEECDTTPYIYIALQLKGETKNNEAISYLKQALNKSGDIDEVYYNLSFRLAIEGKFEEALVYVDSCIELDSQFSNVANLKRDILESQKLNQLLD